MNSFTQSATASAVPSISDLDGYTLRDYNFSLSASYAPADQDEFGFDPPAQRTTYPKLEQTYSPPEASDVFGDWPGFERADAKDHRQPMPGSHEIHKLASQILPNAANAVSRYGQFTPPRTSSADSTGSLKQENTNSPKASTGNERRKRIKAPKDNDPPATSSGRKRKNSRKAAANLEQTDTPEDAKRKASLEKNRLAAAKCRVNKKEKTEQLQRDSHDKAVHNAFLKDQVMRMREEIQQMNAILLAHASCEGCKSPEEIQKHLSQLGNEFLAQGQLPGTLGGYNEFGGMQIDGLPPVSQAGSLDDSYFSMATDQDASMLNPPLPEFDRSADFEVQTPMHTD